MTPRSRTSPYMINTLYIVTQTGDEKKENSRLEDIVSMWFQILKINMLGNV